MSYIRFPLYLNKIDANLKVSTFYARGVRAYDLVRAYLATRTEATTSTDENTEQTMMVLQSGLYTQYSPLNPHGGSAFGGAPPTHPIPTASLKYLNEGIMPLMEASVGDV